VRFVHGRASDEGYGARHYGLGVYTDETSADTLAKKKVPRAERCRRPSTGAAICTVESVWRDAFARSAVSEGFQEGTALVGLAATNPTCCFHGSPDAEGHAVPVRRVIPEGLVQQVAVSYLRHGYWYYVSGWIKRGKDPEQIDRKLIDKYEIAISERERSARKRRGLANLQYIRHRNWFLLLATEGHHPFKQEERNQIRDCRRVPIKFEGYSISYRRSGVTPKGAARRSGTPACESTHRLTNSSRLFSVTAPATARWRTSPPISPACRMLDTPRSGGNS